MPVDPAEPDEDRTESDEPDESGEPDETEAAEAAVDSDIEVPEADAVEQARTVPTDEDEYR
ncbi:hypothetical protein HY68_04685 [Streptomyces sp. AcH 505]|uniref:hypothetical protein n=1 Tax=unclassified Streptomyces TaxID=2593676 RepID=UPI000591CB78|nr:hypothetical protein [Streptomyces sp. NBC_00370]KIF68099.1 hypothetical protein HY68_04685 [Streptomyces sp. AcH 505]